MKIRNLFKLTHQKGDKTIISEPHKLFENVLDEVPINFIFIYPNRRIQKLNKQVCKELQIKEANIINEDFSHHFAILNKKEDILPHIWNDLKNGIRQVELPKDSFLHNKDNNVYILIKGFMNAIYKEDVLTQIIFTYRNAVNELTKEYILNMALSQTKIFPWFYDMKQNVMVIDSRYFEYLNIQSEDNTLTPEQFSEMMHPDDRAAVFDALNHQINGDLIVAPVFYRLHRSDGTWEWFQAQSTYLGQMTHIPYRIVGVCMSIQDHKDIEETLIQARNKAEQSDKLKSAFLANMSHEIRTPLNAIVGFSSILASAQEENEKTEYINIIENNNTLLLQLISDILDLSKIEAGTMEFIFTDFELDTLMHELESTLRGKIKSNQTILQFDLRKTSLFIHGEKNRLSQILINLINNAIKFTEQGSINFGYELRTDNEAQYIYFYVTDTGCGIPNNKINNIFERFVKLDSFAQGTGLGLSICQTIVENLGGEIGVESQPGTGSTFWFTIPYQQGIRPNEEEAIPKLIPVDKNKLLILIAEDNESNFKLFETILKHDYKIIHAWNGQEAVDMFKKHEPHLILMDLNMPVMNGYEATKEIRKLSEFIPIIAVTAFAYSSDEQMVMKKGFTGYMPKPINPGQLKSKIIDALSKCLNLF